MADMQELIARLEEVEAGSRELDLRVFERFDLVDGERWTDADLEYALTDPDCTISPPRLTTSLDAALALAERVLELRGPININVCLAGSAQAQIYPDDPCGVHVQAVASSPALALCIAILKAKAQGEGG